MVGFSVVMFCTAALVYVVGSLIYWRFAPLQPLLIQAIVTIILYPLVAAILGPIHRRFVGAPHGED